MKKMFRADKAVSGKFGSFKGAREWAMNHLLVMVDGEWRLASETVTKAAAKKSAD